MEINISLKLWMLPMAITIATIIIAPIVAKKKEYKGAWGGYAPDLGPPLVYIVALITNLVVWLIYFAFT